MGRGFGGVEDVGGAHGLESDQADQGGEGDDKEPEDLVLAGELAGREDPHQGAPVPDELKQPEHPQPAATPAAKAPAKKPAAKKPAAK